MQDAVENLAEDAVVKEDFALNGIGVVPVNCIKEQNNVDIQIGGLKNFANVAPIISAEN